MEIAEAAENIINEVEAINYKTMSFQGKIAGRLKISVVSTGKYVIPYFLSDFMRANAGVDLILDVTNKSQVIRSLENNEVDFALVSVIPKHLHLNKIQLMQNKLFLTASTSYNFESRASRASMFEDYPLIYREEGSATRNAMEQFLSKNNLPTQKKMTLTSNEALKQAVIAGLGLSIMPVIGIKNALQNNELQIIPFKGLPIVSHWHLIWLKSKNLSPTAQAYLKFVESEKERIIDQTFSWFESYN
jgi:DNA-binding transcriptional LysR family regulator